ncbi:hypothetical protein VDGD_20933 [Verticillium dahliae]|nr:hypothetical protein VDGD_20933 [Verticillium dahliae]
MDEHANFIGKATDPEELKSLIINLQQQFSILCALTSTLGLFTTKRFTRGMQHHRTRET